MWRWARRRAGQSCRLRAHGGWKPPAARRQTENQGAGTAAAGTRSGTEAAAAFLTLTAGKARRPPNQRMLTARREVPVRPTPASRTCVCAHAGVQTAVLDWPGASGNLTLTFEATTERSSAQNAFSVRGPRNIFGASTDQSWLELLPSNCATTAAFFLFAGSTTSELSSSFDRHSFRLWLQKASPSQSPAPAPTAVNNSCRDRAETVIDSDR